MLVVRIVVALLTAPIIAALPYLGFAYYLLLSAAKEGGPAAQGVLAYAAVVAVGAVLAMIFLGIARLSWKTKSMVVRQHLFGWPICLSSLFFLLLAAPSWMEGFREFLILVATAAACAASGVGAGALWLRLSYPNEESG